MQLRIKLIIFLSVGVAAAVPMSGLNQNLNQKLKIFMRARRTREWNGWVLLHSLPCVIIYDMLLTQCKRKQRRKSTATTFHFIHGPVSHSQHFIDSTCSVCRPWNTEPPTPSLSLWSVSIVPENADLISHLTQFVRVPPVSDVPSLQKHQN